MDVTNLILYLKSQITSNSIDQQMVSKAIRLLELGAVFTAQSFTALPSPVGRSGELWLVLLDGLYFSTGDYWIPMAQTSRAIIWSWGANSYGQLGDCTTTSKSSPVSVVGVFTDWCQVSTGDFAGNNHTMAVRSSGSAWAWGNGGSGRLGDNTATSKSSPVSVVGGFTDWCQISTGSAMSVAVRTSGSAWAWGTNASGRLGDNSITDRSSPVSVVGGFSDWRQVSAGGGHTVAIRANGTAWSWGLGTSGRLGDNTTTAKSSPVSVVGGFTDWCQANAGAGHSVAVRTEGSAWAWGCNSVGQLGDNTTTSKSSPVSVVGGFSDWCQVSAGTYHNIAVRTGGSAWAWGCNSIGSLGDCFATGNRSSPVSVVGGFTDWCQVSGGSQHSVAVRTSGSAWAWGCNYRGQLGSNLTTNRSSPVIVVGGFTDWCQVNAGSGTTTAVRNTML